MPTGTKKQLNRRMKDALLSASFALAAAASSNTTSAAIDTGERTAWAIPADDVEILVELPALSATMVPDTRTVTVSIEASATENFASYETLRSTVFTGASGAGVSAQEVRVGFPSDCPRYVRAKVALGASTTDSSAVSATASLVF